PAADRSLDRTSGLACLPTQRADTPKWRLGRDPSAPNVPGVVTLFHARRSRSVPRRMCCFHPSRIDAMRLEEATYIARQMSQIGAGTLSPCLNVGSSTQLFREESKPHITRELIAPLESEGFTFVHSDIKCGEGVDIAGDLFDPSVQEAVRSVGARSVLLTNVLEHVRERRQ